ncbi:MAG: peptide deformylase [Candidatus Pacebacteria bacterium]|nr:peptide deformylase [Candidatus Paceibacterota bacterium]
MVEVLQKGNPILEKIAKEIPLDAITGPEIKNTISQMKEILRNTDDALALAAPQIGESIRMFIISKKIFGECNDDKEDLIFINPKIIKTSKNKNWAEEGCLSVRGVYGEVERFEKATIKAYDEEGKQFTFGGSGLLAQAFQHETDHLDGILFTEKTRNLREDK